MHLGVELHGEEAARRIGGDGEGRVGRGSVDLKARGKLRDMVAMAHPDLFAAFGEPAVKQRKLRGGGRHEGAAEFGGAVASLHLAAQKVHHHLLAIADAQDGHAKAKGRHGRHRRAFGKDRGRAAGKDDGLRREIPQEAVGHLLEGMNFAVDIQLSQTPRDELGHLAAEVDDEKAVMLCHPRGIAAGGSLRKGLRCRLGGRARGFCTPSPLVLNRWRPSATPAGYL
jgi:hypothetical protein